MIDLSVKWAVVAAVAWLLTRRVTPAHAAAAHRLWVAVLVAPIAWGVGELLFAPVAFVRLRPGLLSDSLSSAVQVTSALVVPVYLAGVAMLLARTIVGTWSVHRLTRSTRHLTDQDRLRIRRIVGDIADRVREGDREIPLTAGFVLPMIVLPAGWRSMPAAGLAAVLHHEAAHVRRHDCAVALACALLEALFWFNPLVWIAARQVRWFAEMACDAEAASAMDRQAYAAELLSLAAGWSRARRPQFAITAGAETNVARRIRLLLDEIDHGWRRRALLPAAAVVLLIAVLVAAPLRVGGMVSSAPTTDVGAHPHFHPHGH